MSGDRIASVEFRRERESSWAELLRLVDRCERSGPRALTPDELLRLPGLYRAAVSSLSVARAISLDRNLVDYLDALCVRAYGCVYGVRRGFFEALFDLLARRVPQVVRSRRVVVLLSFATLLLGILVGFATTAADSERFYAYVPSALAQDRGPHATTEALRRTLYADESGESRLAAFAAALFSHNAAVGFVAFAVGVLAGVPTALLVFWNGLMLGAFAAVFASRGLGTEMWAWILPHGVPELTAVVLCGAGGFSLATGLLFPGRLSRGESLAASGREAGVLVVGAVALLLLAGFLEGVVRQTVLDPHVRLAIAFVVSLGVVSWLLLCGREPR